MKAKDFIKKLKFVEALDTEMSADRQDTAELDKNEDDVAPVATPKGIDTSDPQILSVMNGYFRHINELEAGAKGAELQDLCHRMVNVMLEMPGGEKALRGALKGAVKGLGIERGVNENKDQALQLQSKIDAIKKQQDDTKLSLTKIPKVRAQML